VHRTIQKLGVAYGAVASTFFLLWHISALAGYSRLNFLDRREPVMAVGILHGLMVCLAMLPTSGWGVIWEALVDSTRLRSIFRRVLVVELSYFLLQFTVFAITRLPLLSEVMLTTLMLFQTSYVGMFFVSGPELLPPRLARMFGISQLPRERA
jgi:hypothetical protein